VAGVVITYLDTPCTGAAECAAANIKVLAVLAIMYAVKMVGCTGAAAADICVELYVT
jgi:hypothetical protein